MSEIERAIEKKDYIERGAALELFWEYSGNWNLINAIPDADVEPVVRGEWIDHYDECECPVCGETWNYCDNDTERFDCCPKCGARLVEHGKEREVSE